MYLDYFGLRQKPFLITPDPAFLYPSQIHQQALAHLHYGLEREGGFILLTGEVGTGKTTLCRLLIEELPEKFRLAYILNTRLDSAGVLAGICKELNIPVSDSRDVNALVAAIYDDLLAVHANNRHTLVVIEEAQNLAPEVLETLRLLTNLETHSTKLLHILLIGQPELLDTLAQPGLRQLNQRVVSRCHLGPLTRAELLQYMPHRIKMAGSTRPLFTEGAINRIHRKTGGIPRLVNLLAEHCLMGAYGKGVEKVTPAIVGQGARELRSTLKPSSVLVSQHRSVKWGLPLAAVVTLIAMLTGAAVYYSFLPWDHAPSGSVTDSPQPAVERNRPVEDQSGDNQRLSVENQPLDESPADDGLPAVISDQGTDEPMSKTMGIGEAQETPDDISDLQSGVFQDAVTELAMAWSIEGSYESLLELCQFLGTSDLACESTALVDIRDLAAINRPVLVNLKQGEDGWASYTILAMDGQDLRLVNSAGSLSLTAEALFQRLKRDSANGDGIFIWRRPEGYSKPLVPGQVNPPLVDRIQTALGNSGYLQENLVTGGVYSQYLSSLVEQLQRDRGLDVDGIVGVRTLLQLDTTPGPRLLSGGTEE